MNYLLSLLFLSGAAFADTADFIGAEVTCSNEFQNLSFIIAEADLEVEVAITQFKGPNGQLYVRSMFGTATIRVIDLLLIPNADGSEMLMIALMNDNAVIGVATTQKDLSAAEIQAKADIIVSTEKGDKLTFDGSTVSCVIKR